jgi:hypothetical protein
MTKKQKTMKRTMLMAAIALIISAGLSAQNANQNQAQQGTLTRAQARSQEQAGTMTQAQAQAQKQARNEEKKAFKKQQKEMKMQQKQLKNQQGSLNRERYMEQEKTAAKNQGARPATPQRNAVKASRSSGPGKK